MFTFGLKPLLVFFSTLPLIYIAIFVIRLLGMVLVSPLLKVLGACTPRCPCCGSSLPAQNHARQLPASCSELFLKNTQHSLYL